MNQKASQLTLVATLLLLAALSRLVPHPYNFTAVGAMALFGGATLHRRSLAFGLPLAAMYLSDVLLNGLFYREYFTGYNWLVPSLWVYGAIAAISVLGQVFLQKISAGRVAAVAVAGSLAFFIITNFGVWLGSSLYPQTPAGLLACYVAGLPFLGNALAGDVFYSALLFGIYSYSFKPAAQVVR